VRRRGLLSCVLLLIGALGCPHSFGRRGTIDRAVHKDVMEQLKDGRCTLEQLRLYCAVGMDLEECIDRCE